MSLKKILLFSATFFFLSLHLYCQSTLPSLVQDLNVTYAIQSTPDSIPLVIPQAKINLKNTTGIQAIHLIILNDNDSTMYRADYSLSASPVLSSTGSTLFSVSGNLLSINADVIRLDTYTFQIITEDTSGNLSTPYIKLQ